ncbi:unnamed protein product [Porites evermanni]|uniref:Uncharacterized protein n=1 Tax=Porites evermanni TaxID=104178 RepID=A0ABN8RKM6_9CNID|nr:unnamed protein product [Porites evermanni]
MTSFGDTKLRNLGDYFGGNISRGADPMWQGWKRIWNSYRAKYVTCKNARMTPFLHIVFLSMALNYAIDYPHLKELFVCVKSCFIFFFSKHILCGGSITENCVKFLVSVQCYAGLQDYKCSGFIFCCN